MFPRKNKSINRWAAIVALFFLLLFFVITGRFVYLAQAKEVDGQNLIHVAKNQWTEVKAVDSQRGEILDHNGDVLAQDIPAYTVTAVLSHKADSYVKDKAKTAEELAPIINMSASKIESLLNRDAYWVELGPGGRKISYAKKQQIEKLKLPGIIFQTESKRNYPNGQFAPYVVGFTTLDDKLGKQKGVLGIEQSLNDELTEQDGSLSFYRDHQGVKLPDSDKLIKKPKNGDNVYLTLDNKIQTVLEGAMNDVNKKYKPHSMLAVVADPKTGAILAMSNRPSFDPNKRNITNYTNDVISDPYEPGSVMKTFTLAAAINEGVWNSKATYQSGQYKIKGSEPVHDWDQDWGRISFEQGFVRSSNVAFSIVEDKLLGPKRFYNYLQRFGFTKKTGIDLPNESNSRVNFKWHPDQVQASFGQGSAFTAIQIVQAATAIANDGKMMQPYIVQKVVNPDTGKVVQEHQPKQVGTPITKETSEKVRSLMRKVVTDKENGTGKGYAIKNYDVIGKTGTAQISGGPNGYLTGKDNYIFSFLGMAPEKDPKLIVYVAVDRPHLAATETGSEPGEQIFKPVMENALQYMKVQPTGKKIDENAVAAQAVTVDNWVGKSINQAKTALEKQGLDVVTTASQGTVQKQSIASGTKVFKGSKIILVGEGTPVMPDLTGWSLTDVLRFIKVLGIEPKLTGDGYVVSQEPKKGTAIKDKKSINIQLQLIDK
ncbi:penicillin-binding protein 2B [Pullulanibacillus camelliae]|uniref:Penicillin-binding protein 2B n=1 Tax=Pullulanibacillus camelliae TaxID=1707096 RepID=A0A8J2VYF4_9BACL|nr:penicillin-binding protein 2 [Pullulanibacillus camelliae]GGE41310.1 penicillin-binding protein 2B [Pullulanibacillus camelliae]